MELPSHLEDIPIELLGLIGNCIWYQDILNLEVVANRNILKHVTQIVCKDTYTLETAPRIDIKNINIGIIHIDDSILIDVHTPQDFLGCRFYQLVHANFVLPYNKYESMTEFKSYVETFFEFLFGR